MPIAGYVTEELKILPMESVRSKGVPFWGLNPPHVNNLERWNAKPETIIGFRKFILSVLSDNSTVLKSGQNGGDIAGKLCAFAGPGHMKATVDRNHPLLRGLLELALDVKCQYSPRLLCRY